MKKKTKTSKTQKAKGGFDETRRLNKALYEQIKNEAPKTVAVKGQDSVAVGIDESVELKLTGTAGDFFGALNNGATIILDGNAGRFAGDVMKKGKVVVTGNCGEGAGMYMYGGVVVIGGNAGDNIGQISKGGAILAKGSVGDHVGLYLTGGDIVILGNTGDCLGDWMIKGRIFVGGKIKSLGNNTKIEEMSQDDKKFLNDLFAKNGVKFPLENIKKVIPKVLRPFYD